MTYMCFIFLFWLNINNVFAVTVEPVLEDPFDIGGGGSSLTRGTQEGMLISNPATLPYGGVFYRWTGVKTSVFAGADSVETARSQLQGDNAEEEVSQEDILKLVDQPLHIGVSQTVSFILNNGGFTVFLNTHPDLRAWPKGDPYLGIGGPTVVARNEIYAGGVASIASQSYWRWLSFGVNFKYLLINDSLTVVDMTDREAVANLQEQSGAVDQSILNTGTGMDFASLIFKQGQNIDFRLAAVMENLGGLALIGTGAPLEKKQMLHTGASVTLHNEADAIHLSVDYRDVLNAYGEPVFKRIYAGTKILLRQYVGISSGVYHGSPSYGAEIDFILFRLSAATYRREYGATPGVDQRRVYVISLTTGY
ncbi:MAG: hypothetical protein AB8C84_10420 [Oligoflexales bacterium]